MKTQEKSSRPKKIPKWVFGLLLGVHLLGCASPDPRPEAPLPPLRRTPTLQETPPTIPDPRPALQEAPAADPEELPASHPQTPATPAEAAPLLPAPVKAETRIAFHVHIVRWSGETLSAVAAWYTGDAKNWRALAEASPEINPNLIHEGNKIFIPEMLLKTHEPMPREFVDQSYSRSKKEKPQPKPQPAQEQEPELQLFGPRKTPSK